MTKIVHEEYLRAYLDNVHIEFRFEGCLWKTFDINEHRLETFNTVEFEFRYTPKVVEVSLTDFYAEYDKYNNHTGNMDYIANLQDLIDKYLPRNGVNGDIK